MDKKLGGNIAALVILQKANYILPFIIVPYLTRVLGPGNFGKISFVQAVINYFLLVTDYGFNFSSTQQIAKYGKDKKKMSEVFWTTTFSKMLIGLTGFILLVIALSVIPQLKKDAILYVIAYSVVLQSIFFPVWFFQGIEKNSYLIPIAILPKVVSLFLVFIYVKGTDDYIPALIIQSVVTFIISAVISIFILCKKQLVQWYFPSFAEIKATITEGWHFFLSTAAISLYTISNIVILGVLSNDRTVGYFVAADKLVKGVQSLIFSIGHAAYPRINVYITEGKEKAALFLRTCVNLMGASGLVASLGLFIFAELIIGIVFGLDQYGPSVNLLRIMSVTPFVVSVSYALGILGMLTFGLKKRLSYIYLITGILSLALTIPVTYFFSMQGTAWCIVIIEIFVTLALLAELKNNGIRLYGTPLILDHKLKL